jgi:hypothetical protein
MSQHTFIAQPDRVSIFRRIIYELTKNRKTFSPSSPSGLSICCAHDFELCRLFVMKIVSRFHSVAFTRKYAGIFPRTDIPRKI